MGEMKVISDTSLIPEIKFDEFTSLKFKEIENRILAINKKVMELETQINKRNG